MDKCLASVVNIFWIFYFSWQRYNGNDRRFIFNMILLHFSIYCCEVCVILFINISEMNYLSYRTTLDILSTEQRAPAVNFRFLGQLFIELNSSARTQTAKKQLCAFARFISTFRNPQFGCFIPQSILIFIHLLLRTVIYVHFILYVYNIRVITYQYGWYT